MNEHPDESLGRFFERAKREEQSVRVTGQAVRAVVYKRQVRKRLATAGGAAIVLLSLFFLFARSTPTDPIVPPLAPDRASEVAGQSVPDMDSPDGDAAELLAELRELDLQMAAIERQLRAQQVQEMRVADLRTAAWEQRLEASSDSSEAAMAWWIMVGDKSETQVAEKRAQLSALAVAYPNTEAGQMARQRLGNEK